MTSESNVSTTVDMPSHYAALMVLFLSIYLVFRFGGKVKRFYRFCMMVESWNIHVDHIVGINVNRYAAKRVRRIPVMRFATMEDQVPFKVYTFWRAGAKPEVRRFGVDRNVVSSYTYLLAKIHDVFPRLKEKSFSVSWQDEEGDDVKVSSDEEVMTMLTAAPAALFKLYVHVENDHEGEEEHVINVEISAPRAEPFVYTNPGKHVGVVCDGCSRDVIGFRYKCITCDDFDLCSACEAQGTHSDHCFVRIPSPQMSLQVVKDSIRKSRYFLKSFAATLYEAQKKHRAEMKRSGCPAAAAAAGACAGAGPAAPPHCSAKVEAKLAAKERREERREERHDKHRERHEKRQERREEERRERRENPHERVGWMDIFSKYVDQFANLAADHIRVATNDAAEQTPQAADAPNPYIDPTEFAKMMNACMNIREGCPFAEAFGPGSSEGAGDSAQGASDKPASAPSTSQTSQASTSQVPTQAPTQQVPTEAPSAQVPTQAPSTLQVPITPQVSTTPLIPTQVPITPQVVPNPVKPVEESKVDNTGAGSVSSRDASPDKSAEGWTMINDEKDLEGEAAANPAEIDSNLPEEFQPRPGAPYGFIYPPLNASTAEPAAAGGAQTDGAATQAAAAAQPQLHYVYKANHAQGGMPKAPLAKPAQASAPAAPRPSAPGVEERQHRVPHIDAAIRQMLAMGFTNEGGWLTQLVESKDGNIAAVLDLLTPVNPQRK